MKFNKILGRTGISAGLVGTGMASAMMFEFGMEKYFLYLLSVSVALLIAGHALLKQARELEEEE